MDRVTIQEHAESLAIQGIKMPMPIKLVAAALGIRSLSICILLIQSSTHLIPCFDCSAHFTFGQFQSLMRWDTLHFFSIQSILRSEQHFAFSPAIFQLINLFRSSAPFYHHHPLLLLFSICSLATAFSIASSLVLFYLTLEIFHSIKFARLTTILHILSPSPSTQVVPYTEPFFAFFSFSAIYGHVLVQKYSLSNRQYLKKIVFKCFVASLAALATSFRSLGILHSAFWCFDFLRFFLRNFSKKYLSLSNFKSSFLEFYLPMIINGTETLIMTLITISPFVYDQWIGYQNFCQFKHSENQDEIGFVSQRPRPWCSNSIPSIYNFVQSHYWGVGFLKYWTWHQLPLFLLSSPIYLVTMKSLIIYYRFYVQADRSIVFTNSEPIKKVSTRNIQEYNKAEPKDKFYRPFLSRTIGIYAHVQLLLTLLLLLNSHVQIILRQASTMPFIWWGLADQVGLNWNWWSSSRIHSQNKSSHSSKISFFLKSWYFYWLVVWWPVSLILWAGFYPPA